MANAVSANVVFSLYWHVFTTCPAVYRAAMVGRSAAAVKHTDRQERITAVSVRGAYGAWTTIVPGEKTSSIHASLFSNFFPYINLHLCGLVSILIYLLVYFSVFSVSGLTTVSENSTRSTSSSFSFTLVSTYNMFT